MPFNPDIATCPEETCPTEALKLHAAHCFMEDMLSYAVSRAVWMKGRGVMLDWDSILCGLEHFEDAMSESLKPVLAKLHTLSTDYSSTPDDWKQKLEAAAKEVGA